MGILDFASGSGSSSSSDKKTNTLMTIGGVAVLAGIGYYAWQHGLLGDFFNPEKKQDPNSMINDKDEGEDEDAKQANMPATVVSNPYGLAPGDPRLLYPVQPPVPVPTQPTPPSLLYQILNPNLDDDGVNDATALTGDPILHAIQERGSNTSTPDDDTNDNNNNNVNKHNKSACSRCKKKCDGASKKHLRECEDCNAKNNCGYKIRISSKGKVKVTGHANMALALAGMADGLYGYGVPNQPRYRIKDRAYILTRI